MTIKRYRAPVISSMTIGILENRRRLCWPNDGRLALCQRVARNLSAASRSRSPVASRSCSSPRIVAITSVAVRVAVAGSVCGPCASTRSFIQSVHRHDAARLFRLALESAPAGSVLHAVGDEGVPIREIAELFAAHLNVPAVSVTAEQAGEYVGWLGRFWGTHGPATAQITRDLLGWQPTRPGLIADLKENHYFA